MTREQLEALDDEALVDLINLAYEVRDIKAGSCTDCHGTGRFPGDEEYPCDSCGGNGSRADQLREADLQELGYTVTSSTSGGDPPLTTWLVYRPDGKPLPDHYASEDAAWEAAFNDNTDWGDEGDD